MDTSPIETFRKFLREHWLRLIFFTAIFGLLSAVVPYVIFKELGGQSLAFDRRLVSWPVVGGGLGLLLAYFSCDGLRLYYTLNALGRHLPKYHLGKLVFINILFSNITPMATGGGFAQIWFLRRYGVPVGTATAATTMRTFLAIVFIFTLTPFFLVSLDPFQNSAVNNRLGSILALFAGSYLGVFMLILLRMRWIVMAVDSGLRILYGLRLIDRTRYRSWRLKAMREIIRFSRGMKDFLKGPKKDIVLSVFYTGLFLLALFSFPYLLFRGLDYRIDYMSVTGLMLVATFIMYFSPTPGGAGFAEGVFGLFFASRIAPADLILVIIIWRFLTIYLGMLIGVPVTVHELMRKRLKHA